MVEDKDGRPYPSGWPRGLPLGVGESGGPEVAGLPFGLSVLTLLVVLVSLGANPYR